MKNRVVLIGLSILLATACPMAQNNTPPPEPPPALGLKNVEMSVKLLSPISTKTSQKGDSFTAQVLAPDQYKDAIFEGHIEALRQAKKRDKAQISFRFETITFRGLTHPIQADLKDVSNSQGVKNVDEENRVIGKSSHKKQVEAALLGSALGGLLGASQGGGKGAAVGAAAGAGAGLLFAVTFTTSGADMEFAPGSQFTLDVSDGGRQ